MKPVDQTYIDSMELHSNKEVNDNLKLVIVKEFPSTKIFLLKDTHQIGVKKFL